MSSSKAKLEDAADNTGEAGRSVASAAKQAAINLSDQVTHHAAGAWEKAAELGHRAADAVSDGYVRVSDGTRHAMQKGRAAAVGWEHGFEGYVRRKPLTTLLVGVGVGVLIGIAIGTKRSSR